MIKLKGGDADDKNSIMNSAAKRMGLPMKGTSTQAQNFTSPGSHHAQQLSSSSSSAIPDGPTPIAQRLGMPSASKSVMGAEHGRSAKDWSLSQNRINLGGPVYIKGKSQSVASETTNDSSTTRRQKIGDETVHSDEEKEDEEHNEDSEDHKVLASLRAQRLAELKKSANKQQEWLALGHGSLTEIEQDAFLKSVTGSKYVLCHFFHASFERCKIFDHHLSMLSARHLPTRFININAEKAPFFVGKLQIKVLPTIVCFKDGIAVDRVVGFEDLGAVDDFETSQLEDRLAKSGCILAKDAAAGSSAVAISSIRSGQLSRMLDEDEEDDS